MLSLVNVAFSQDARIFENNWYLTNIIENGISHLPPTDHMGIIFEPQMFNAQGCLSMMATVTFENNNTNFSATNFQYCLCICYNEIADAYETNVYFPFLNSNYDPTNIEYFNYNITELLGVRTLIINTAFNKQAIYSNVMLSDKKFEKFDFSISPNPSNDILEITLNNQSNENTIAEFYNEMGQICKTENLKLNTTKVDLSTLSSGIYIVKIKSKNQIVTKKWIKM